MGDDAHSDTALDTTLATNKPRPARAPSHVPEAQRYAIGDVIGRGGMGEVRVAHDARVRREVAIKRMRSELSDGSLQQRFFREAHVQGALDHPAIPPVHDLGIDPDGNPYFVMKRLAGVPLVDVLASKDPELRARWPRRLLLSRFVDICLAIEFAHTRKVIHRDIKPGNIMLGDFGEAYVLDWGLARIDGDDTAPIAGSASGDDSGTVAGELLGTPGYMSPEQVRGDQVTPSTDVFGLGCVLYEILAGVPALPRGIAALDATLSAPHHRPSACTDDVPPELDDLCARATASSPDERPTARELGEEVQRYLDGDRDEARRRTLANEHAARAVAACAKPGDEARAIAMREAGRAIALDPSNSAALGVVGTLLLLAPHTLPAPALAAADAERTATRTHVMRQAGYGYFLFAAVAVGLLFLPPLHAWPLYASLGMLGTGSAILLVLSRKPLPFHTRWYLVVVGVNSTGLLCVGLVFGPLLVLPMVLVGSLAGFLIVPTGYRAWVPITAHLAPFALLVGLEIAGVLPSTFELSHGALRLTSWTLELTPITTAVVLFACLVSQTVSMSFVVLSGRDAAVAAQNRLHAQKWHLSQLIPADAQLGSDQEVK